MYCYCIVSANLYRATHICSPIRGTPNVTDSEEIKIQVDLPLEGVSELWKEVCSIESNHYKGRHDNLPAFDEILPLLRHLPAIHPALAYCFGLLLWKNV